MFWKHLREPIIIVDNTTQLYVQENWVRMKELKVSEEDPIIILEFLSRFVECADTLEINQTYLLVFLIQILVETSVR